VSWVDSNISAVFGGSGLGRRMFKSSVKVEFDLPDETAPPWVCFAGSSAPVVVRRYEPDSRTCDFIGGESRWQLESALVPLTPQMPHFLRRGWNRVIGEVQVGWKIVYLGNEMWFPQRVLEVEAVSSDWQRVWTLGDMKTRDIWSSTDFHSWDNDSPTIGDLMTQDGFTGRQRVRGGHFNRSP